MLHSSLELNCLHSPCLWTNKWPHTRHTHTASSNALTSLKYAKSQRFLHIQHIQQYNHTLSPLSSLLWTPPDTKQMASVQVPEFPAAAPLHKKKKSPSPPHTQLRPTAGLVPGKMKTHYYTPLSWVEERGGRKKRKKNHPSFDWAADSKICLKFFICTSLTTFKSKRGQRLCVFRLSVWLLLTSTQGQKVIMCYTWAQALTLTTLNETLLVNVIGVLTLQ